MKTLGTCLIVVGAVMCLTIVMLGPGIAVLGAGALLRIAAAVAANPRW